MHISETKTFCSQPRLKLESQSSGREDENILLEFIQERQIGWRERETPPFLHFIPFYPHEKQFPSNQGNLHFWALIGIHECVGKEETFSRAEPGVMWAGPPITQATRESNIQGTWGRQWSCWDKCQRLGSIVLAFMLSRGRCILFKKT